MELRKRLKKDVNLPPNKEKGYKILYRLFEVVGITNNQEITNKRKKQTIIILLSDNQ